MDVSFYQSWRAFPHTRDQDDSLVVSVHPHGRDRGGNYEFSVTHVGTKGNRQPIALQACLFSDSWRAFADLPEFFNLLGLLDESASEGRSTLSLNDLIPSLEAMGWRDETDQYANQHSHVIGCLICGERHTATTA